MFDAFIAHFRGPDFAARASNDLFNVSQQAEETVDTFALRFSDLLELAMETDLRMDAVHQINLFSRALRPELQETVMKQRPDTLLEATRLARNA